ncbi:histidine phosphatase family protein [Caenispirillum bisanense]|uniref:histidine phosphatase family protein n=1 Tax=Caenispirillum bisanense TaxID=414052 RepID=UPI0031DE33D1
MTTAGERDRSTRWWWLRHAPVEAGPGEIVGALDHPCRADALAAAPVLAAVLARRAVVVTSPLARCRATAAALGLEPADAVEPALVEQDFGRWQGRCWNDLPTADTDPFWQAPSTARPPGGESFADVVARLRPAVAALAERHAGRDIIAVAHAGTIRAALVLALGLEAQPAAGLSFAVDPLSLTRIDLMEGGAAVRCVNWRPLP